jgi:hypothetical protein
MCVVAHFCVAVPRLRVAHRVCPQGAHAHTRAHGGAWPVRRKHVTGSLSDAPIAPRLTVHLPPAAVCLCCCVLVLLCACAAVCLCCCVLVLLCAYAAFLYRGRATYWCTPLPTTPRLLSLTACGLRS